MKDPSQDLQEELKLKDRELQILQENFDSIIAKSADGILVLKDNGIIVFVNPAAERIFNRSFAELEGQEFGFPIKSDEKIEIDILRKGGGIGTGLMGFSETTWKGEKAFLVAINDITELKVTQAEKAGLEEQLRQSTKMEAIGTMAGGIAHDFNNILTIILGNAEMAAEDLDPDSDMKQIMDEIISAGQRASGLVAQILSFSRKSTQELRPIKPHLHLHETFKMLRATIPKSVEIQTDFKADCGNIIGDPGKLQQVIINLATNAVQSMQEKGTIRAGLRRVFLNAGDIDSKDDIISGPYIHITINDSGPGIPDEIVERIFDPFFTTKDIGKGTGLGLSVVYGIVKDHLGSITVVNEPEGGCTFHVYLPITERRVDDAELKSGSMATGRERILFIDDEEALATLGGRLLESLGYQVTILTSSIDALELFKSGPEQFDLIITDQTMPGMTGSELIAEILKIRPEIPIILCTGFSSSVSEENARAMGIGKYVKKPYKKIIMSEAIRQVLDGKTQAATGNRRS